MWQQSPANVEGEEALLNQCISVNGHALYWAGGFCSAATLPADWPNHWPSNLGQRKAYWLEHMLWQQDKKREETRQTQEKERREQEKQRSIEAEERIFEYSPLQSDTHFRVLCILPGGLSSYAVVPPSCGPSDTGQSSAQIKYILEQHDINSPDAPMYTAISYTWGAEGAQRAIRIKDKSTADEMPHRSELLIRENLAQLLENLQDPKHVRRVWIDALCIDQRSVSERNHQVKMMGRIYTQANYVVAWLKSSGEDVWNRELSYAFDLMREEAHPQIPAHPYLTAFSNLRYWSRKWIIQEIIQAPTVVLQYEQHTLPMKVMEDFFGQRRNDNGLSSLFQTSCARIALHRLNRREQNAIPRSLHELLPRYRENQCSVPCDHVYALYNMIGEHRRELEIDYAQNPCERLRTVLSFMQQHEGMPPAYLSDYFQLLRELLGLSMASVLEHAFAESAHMLCTAFDLGEVREAEESSESQSQRRRLESLRRTPTISLTRAASTWITMEAIPSIDPTNCETISVHDFAHFEVLHTELCGLASFRLRSGDRVWLFRNMSLAFIVRVQDENRISIVDRAYLWTESKDTVDGSSRAELATTQVSSLIELERDGLPFGVNSKQAKAAAREISLPMGSYVRLLEWATRSG